MKQKALRAGSHCGGEEGCRLRGPSTAENPASRILFNFMGHIFGILRHLLTGLKEYRKLTRPDAEFIIFP